MVPVQKKKNYCFKVEWNGNYKIKYQITWNKTIKFVKGWSGYMDVWSLCQKIFGLTSINPNISALKYGRDMEQHASNTFFEIFKCGHKKPRLFNWGLFLDGEQTFIGACPDGIVECACHDRACLEIKYPF